ncbi:30S ribosomal protein S6 [Pannus brasiliensis CCIBt3594]|uniref:Small ribosomal subunit protein bS6 n=1 Tax=Pannus brasiliensis CCIBt3594 TaxID=1427578 RepID=A0AAW9QNE3_9CHRO
MSSNYETLYIVRPDLGEDQLQQEVGRYRDLIGEHGATDIQVKVWGKKRLAYPIGKFNDGVYVQMNYQALGKQVAPMERAMRLSDEVIRYLTLKLDRVVEPPADLSPVTEIPPTPVVDDEADDDGLSAEE